VSTTGPLPSEIIVVVDHNPPARTCAQFCAGRDRRRQHGTARRIRSQEQWLSGCGKRIAFLDDAVAGPGWLSRLNGAINLVWGPAGKRINLAGDPVGFGWLWVVGSNYTGMPEAAASS
jgi:hypothetical protein